MQEFDFTQFIKDIGAILNLKVSGPVMSLLKMIVKTPLYMSPRYREKYLEAVKELNAIEMLNEAKKKDLILMDSASRKYLAKLDMSNIESKQLKEELSSLSLYRSLLEELQYETRQSDERYDEHNAHWYDLDRCRNPHPVGGVIRTG